MSTLTSVFGMFPLVIFPGAGSELVQRIRFSSNRRLKFVCNTYIADSTTNVKIIFIKEA